MNHPSVELGPSTINSPEGPMVKKSSSEPSPFRQESTPAKRSGRGRELRFGLLGGVLVVGAIGIFLMVYRIRTDAARRESVSELPLRLVTRVDFQTRMTASGRVESHQKTVISCELERLSITNEGRTITSGGNTNVLEVVEEGKQVKKGDILCRLGSSEYEELVRTQQMKTDQARAALEQARLSFSVAELAVSEYREGLIRQNLQVMEGQIALAQSDMERANDRLRWTVNMLGKGYVPVAQRTSAERTLAEAEFQLKSNQSDLQNFNKYGNPRALKELESEVEKRRYEFIANTQRVARLDERLKHYRKMVDLCTIRSPHDGLVIYAIDPRRRNAPRLEPGVEVRQQQELFYLPDLSDMEVVTYLHESVAQQVLKGMSARVSIEGIGNQSLVGRVVNVGPLPVSSPVWTISEEVKYFVATIKLDRTPAGLLPGMSAEVEIALDQSQDVLAVPSEAVASQEGHDVCYVAGADGLERRQITLGRSNRNLLEVTKGLAEGEEVVINPDKLDSLDTLLVHSPENIDKEHSDSANLGNGTAGVD